MKKFRRFFAVFVCVTVLLGSTPLGGFKAEAEYYSGNLTAKIHWSLNTNTGEFHISGSGNMPNWSSILDVPWYSYSTHIKKVTIGSGIYSIGSNAFYNCINLANINLPYDLTTIGDYAFSSCISLTSITLPNYLETIGNGAFSNCDHLTSITIPDKVTSIGNYAFDRCRILGSVYIGKSVTSIGSMAFDECYGLTGISVHPDNTAYSSDENGVLFNKDKTKLIKYPRTKAEKSYVIPESVTSISDWAFQSTFLTNITIPDGVTDIGFCTFASCGNLTSIIIPDTVTSIDDMAFHYCNSLTDVYYTGTQAQWRKISIGTDNKNLTSANFHFNYHDHIAGEWETETEPTCISEGLKVKKCQICSEVLESQPIEMAKEHSYSEEITTPPTCTTAGVKTLTCICGDSYTKPISATGHSLKQVTVEATCLEDGKSCYQCQNCFIEYGATVIPAKGHKHEGSTSKAPTCYSEGIKEYRCVCGDTYTVTLPTVDHDKVRYFTAPTSIEPGFDYYICSFCGNMIGDMIFIPSTGFEPINGMVVDYANNIVYGFDAGVNSLNSYTELVTEGSEWSYEEGQYGFGTGTIATLKNGDETIAEYTVVIFGDIDGNGWYDANDAFLVRMIANGIIDKSVLGQAQQRAADCNHDGEINELDFDLLINASVLLDDVDQSATKAELATNSVYIEYMSLIDQSAGLATDTDDPAPETNVTETEIGFEAIFAMIYNILKQIFAFVLSFIIA